MYIFICLFRREFSACCSYFQSWVLVFSEGDFTLTSKKHAKREEIEDKVTGINFVIGSQVFLFFLKRIYCFFSCIYACNDSIAMLFQVVWVTGASRGIGMLHVVNRCQK